MWGLIGLGSTVGVGGGPLLVGAVFDATASYTAAFELCAAMVFGAALAVAMISPAEGVEAIPASALRAVGH